MTAIDTWIADLQSNDTSALSQPLISKVATVIAALNFIAGGLSPSGPEAANKVFAGPTSGAAALPTFRVLHANDLSAITTLTPLAVSFGSAGGGLIQDTAANFGYTLASKLLTVNAVTLGGGVQIGTDVFDVAGTGTITTDTSPGLHIINATAGGSSDPALVVETTTGNNVSIQIKGGGGIRGSLRYTGSGFGLYDGSGGFILGFSGNEVFCNDNAYIQNASFGAGSTKSFLSITGTWNDGATVFNGALLVNVTNTASAGASLLADLQIGGVSQFKVDKTGQVTILGGITGNGSLTLTPGGGNSVTIGGSGSYSFNGGSRLSNPGADGTLRLAKNAGGSTVDLDFTTTNQLKITGGGLTVGSTTLLTGSAGFTNNAGAQIATITNGPTAGNPTKWIPINDNGTTRNIPAW